MLMCWSAVGKRCRQQIVISAVARMQDKVPNVINGGECLQQLRFAGVFEAVSIRKQGFPFRDKHSEFYRQ